VSHDALENAGFFMSFVPLVVRHKKLSYHDALLVNSCCVSRGTGVTKVSNSKRDIQKTGINRLLYGIVCVILR